MGKKEILGRTGQKRMDIRVNDHDVHCLIGTPPDNIEPLSVAVQLCPGLVSGHAMFSRYAPLLNGIGYTTAVIEHRKPGPDNHEEVLAVSKLLLEGSFGVNITELSFATHSLGTRNTVHALMHENAGNIIAQTRNMVMIAPVGFGGVQFMVGAARTVASEIASMPNHKDARSMASDAFKYSLRAGLSLRTQINEARNCDLIDSTRELVERGIGIGAVLFTHDNLVHSKDAEKGLGRAGVKMIKYVEGNHNSVLFRPDDTFSAAMSIVVDLDAERTSQQKTKEILEVYARATRSRNRPPRVV